jgi:hypothetical protein
MSGDAANLPLLYVALFARCTLVVNVIPWQCECGAAGAVRVNARCKALTVLMAVLTDHNAQPVMCTRPLFSVGDAITHYARLSRLPMYYDCIPAYTAGLIRGSTWARNA